MEECGGIHSGLVKAKYVVYYWGEPEI